VNQRCRGDLFGEWILGVWDAKTAPYLCNLLIERKDSISVCGRYSQEPPLEPLCLRFVAPVANSLDALTELADGYGRKKEFDSLLTGSGEECSDARVAPVALASLADYIRVD